MKHILLAGAFLLAACGQSSEASKDAEAPAPPADALSQLQTQSAENQPVFAWQQLTAYQQAHPEAQPPCTSIRRAEARGVVPTDVAPDSIYAAHVGATVFSIQCGPQLTRARNEPAEHWLVIFAPGAASAEVVNCADGSNDRCAGLTIPRAAAAPASP
jgi:hypothetical protein